MLPNTTAELLENADDATIECSPEVLEELRRAAVDGFIAFGRGGLEIGGVLYGVREGNRVSVSASAELACEHALGPGFVLSETDRATLARLLDAPDGLEAVGWYRSHTRRGLDLDGSDRELFDHFPANEKCVGLVLKPSQWGPSAAAFFARGETGEIRPPAPREFTIQPPPRKPREAPEAEAAPAPLPTPAAALEAARVPEPANEAAAAIPAAMVLAEAPVNGIPPVEAPVEDRGELLPHEPSLEFQMSRRGLVTVATLLALIALAIYFWPRPSHRLGLQAYSISPGQVRIEWNHNSAELADGASGTLQIRDGDSDRTIPLDANQLRVSSITYMQKSGHLAVDLRVDPNQPGVPSAEESIEFVGPVDASANRSAEAAPTPQPAGTAVETPAPTAQTPAPTAQTPAPTAQTPPPSAPSSASAVQQQPGAERSQTTAKSEAAAKKPDLARVREPISPPPSRTVTAPKRFQPTFPPPKGATAREAVLLPAPDAPAAVTAQSQLPELITRTPAPASPIVPPAPQPRPPSAMDTYKGPRSGRLIWTGDLARRGVVEIDGAHTSVGSLSGALLGVPADYRVSPAEFTRDGLTVYTTNGALNGRTEPPAKSNGWNILHFVYDPVRAAELVVLERPSSVNNFNRLVVRNDARSCAVILLDWAMQADARR